MSQTRREKRKRQKQFDRERRLQKERNLRKGGTSRTEYKIWNVTQR